MFSTERLVELADRLEPQLRAAGPIQEVVLAMMLIFARQANLRGGKREDFIHAMTTSADAAAVVWWGPRQ